jgi:hypothetical protein
MSGRVDDYAIPVEYRTNSTLIRHKKSATANKSAFAKQIASNGPAVEKLRRTSYEWTRSYA